MIGFNLLFSISSISMWFISGVQKSSIKVGDRVRVKPTITTPQYKWGSVTHTSVGLVTSISPNGRDLTVDFPMHSNWAGLTSEMEVVPCYHPGVTCNGCGLGPIAGRLNNFRVNFSSTIFTEIKDGAALHFFFAKYNSIYSIPYLLDLFLQN